MLAPADYPTVADVAAYLGLSTPPDMADVHLAAAIEVQAASCDIRTYTQALAMAAVRRCARSLAARSANTGYVNLGEFGSAPLPRWDAEIERLEAPYRRAPLA